MSVRYLPPPMSVGAHSTGSLHYPVCTETSTVEPCIKHQIAGCIRIGVDNIQCTIFVKVRCYIRACGINCTDLKKVLVHHNYVEQKHFFRGRDIGLSGTEKTLSIIYAPVSVAFDFSRTLMRRRQKRKQPGGFPEVCELTPLGKYIDAASPTSSRHSFVEDCAISIFSRTRRKQPTKSRKR